MKSQHLSKAIVVLMITACFLESVNCLRCYKCSDKDTCSDPFKGGDELLVSCDGGQCSKVILADGTVDRACSNLCETSKNGYCCKSDKCNGSNTLVFNYFLAFTAIFYTIFSK
ncbi:hypothetical protein BpHYR1_022453 [Brachionus plicatilis]|uniref:Uncharacterized protein n=1 Tax=Brachionus plicatilis TaxID=10195 RepID=A0A3M7R0A5_BRAPC|nr:hypothetical protein BpHYR1_022453 [Brachionus plicatilis]